MNNENLIRQLSALTGIADAYRDHRGQPVAISADSLAGILVARGFETRSEQPLREAIAALSNASGEFRIPPVTVLRESAPQTLELEIPRACVSERLGWRLRTEQGARQAGEFVPQDHVVREFENHVLCKFEFREQLQSGYHWLTFSGPAELESYRTRVIVAPNTTWNGEPDDRSEWGVSLQLYCLKSARNWGIGDFTDLANLAAALGAEGADFLGVNPLHSLYPSNPEHASPYSPSSRAMINYLYIDVEAVPEFSRCDIAQAKVSSEYFQGRLRALRSASLVDYSGVAFLKLVILKHLYETFLTEELDSGTQRSSRFLDFIEQGGAALEESCIFYAIYAHNQKASRTGGFHNWPVSLQNPLAEAVAEFAESHQDTIRFYMYLQWLADEQLQLAHSAALAAGMRIGLYRDLAVGIDSSGADMWRNQQLYCDSASVGAPPDALAPQGQDWGLPPMDPANMHSECYETLIADLRSNMRHCGALRLDHVMQLARLWWTPAGRPSSEGAYIRYPLEDLLGVIALESHRSRCRIIGEDLGVVPKEIRDTLPREKIWSYKIVLFEKDDEGRVLRPADYADRAMATLTTHDMPTLPGYWRGADLLLREKLGLFTNNEEKDRAWNARIADRQALVDALKREGLYPDVLPGEANQIDELPEDLLLAFERFLAMTASRMVCVQMEDWMGVVDPVNVPGTSTEYPNWRRRLPEDFENLVKDGRLARHAAALNRDVLASASDAESE